MKDRKDRQAKFQGAGDIQDEVFFAAVASAGLPMVIADPLRADMPVVFANQAFLDLTGYPLDEILGTNCRFLQGLETAPQVRATIRQAIAEQRSLSIEVRNYRRDGSVFWNSLFISPVFQVDGKLRYYFGTQLDVSQRREAEAALRQAQKMQAIGELTAGIAHDFNNLLTVLMGGVALLGTDASPDRQQRSQERMLQALVRARRLTTQLLAFASRQQLNPQPEEMNSLVEKCNEMARDSLGPAISLQLELDPSPCPVTVDCAQVQAALVALLANARDAMPGGGQVVIRTECVEVDATVPPRQGITPGHYCVLAVEDTGHGMTPEVLRRAPEPFFTTRHDQPGRSSAGLGLGLSGVYGFMRQSSGHLQIESQPGEGTRVRLLFPMEPR